MLQTFSQKFITVLVVLLLLGAFGYYVYSSNSAPVAAPDVSSTGDDSLSGDDILALANKLDAITIDQAVLTSALFESLVDHDSPLSPEVQGRSNPFAIFGTANLSGNSTKTSTLSR